MGKAKKRPADSAGDVSEFTGRSSEMRDPDSPWLAAEDLMDLGRDLVVQIGRVTFHKNAVFDGGRKEDVHALEFVGKHKRLVLNATNRRTLVALFGTTQASAWKEQWIALFVNPEVPAVGGGTTAGIRIRPTRPKRRAE